MLFASQETADRQRQLRASNQTDRLHYCYRCYDCHRLVTKLEVLWAQGTDRPNLCPCGSRKVKPTNPLWWEELFLPRCWKLIYAMYTRRLSGPPEPMTAEEQADADRTARAAMLRYQRDVIDSMKKT